jgi:hypothetical protein
MTLRRAQFHHKNSFLQLSFFLLLVKCICGQAGLWSLNAKKLGKKLLRNYSSQETELFLRQKNWRLATVFNFLKSAFISWLNVSSLRSFLWGFFHPDILDIYGRFPECCAGAENFGTEIIWVFACRSRTCRSVLEGFAWLAGAALPLWCCPLQPKRKNDYVALAAWRSGYASGTKDPGSKSARV